MRHVSRDDKIKIPNKKGQFYFKLTKKDFPGCVTTLIEFVTNPEIISDWYFLIFGSAKHRKRFVIICLFRKIEIQVNFRTDYKFFVQVYNEYR